MRSFLLSLESEFFKTRKTLAFWIAILLPLLLVTILFAGTYSEHERARAFSGQMLWMNYMGVILNVMGGLLLPMYIIFSAYSINAIEHRADTWKSLFSLPVSKWGIYGSKFMYVVLLNGLCLFLFASLILASGNLLGLLEPDLKFSEYSVAALIYQIHLKLFLSTLGVLAIQFLLSLIWADFLKPMGIGFFLTIAGIIVAAPVHGWKYAWTLPYSHPALALRSMTPSKSAVSGIDVGIFSREIVTSLLIAAVAFTAGYFVVARRSVK